jgi:hypothetical protein
MSQVLNFHGLAISRDKTPNFAAGGRSLSLRFSALSSATISDLTVISMSWSPLHPVPPGDSTTSSV